MQDSGTVRSTRQWPFPWTARHVLTEIPHPAAHRVQRAAVLRAIDLDQKLHATGVAIPYRWSVNGVQYERYAASGSSDIVLHLDRSVPFTGNEEAQQILGRLQTMGRTETVSAIAGLTATPNMTASITTTEGGTLSGLITSVEWQIGAGTMSVGTRNLT